jgi:hypothetical protein
MIFQSNKTPGSLQINLLFTMYAEHAAAQKPMQNFYFFRRQTSLRSTHTAQRPPAIIGRPVRSAAQRRDSVRTEYGGAERDRTADPLLAKQVLSQLSYSPIQLDRHPDFHPNGSATSRINTNSRAQINRPVSRQHAKANGGPG